MVQILVQLGEYWVEPMANVSLINRYKRGYDMFFSSVFVLQHDVVSCDINNQIYLTLFNSVPRLNNSRKTKYFSFSLSNFCVKTLNIPKIHFKNS